MAKGIERLSPRAVATAKCPPGKSARFLADGGGLYLRVGFSGSKSWIYRYMIAGKSRDMGLGPLHTVGLAEARSAAREQRRLRHAGQDPIEARSADKLARRANVTQTQTFADAAAAYIRSQETGWSAKHANEWRVTLDKYANPIFGELAVAAVDSGLIRRALDPVWVKRPETARRVLDRIRRVLDAAAAAGYRDPAIPNPARWEGHLKLLMPARAKAQKDKRHPSLPYSELPVFLVELRQRAGITPRALEFLILTATRTKEVYGATWAEIDENAHQWIIPAARMKTGKEHRVALSDAALSILAAIPRSGKTAIRPFPIAGSAMLELVKRHMGRVGVTPHGFRATFSTWVTEQTDTPIEIRELALAHVSGDKVAAAYQRSVLLEKRRTLMERWGRFCAGEEVTIIELRPAIAT
jgi:integrase